MATWFTSDSHFGHANIIRFCERPYRSASEMDADMIQRWVTRVAPQDTIYHLGDFMLGKDVQSRTWGLLVRLPGRKHLVRGNHDPAEYRNDYVGWASVNNQMEIVLDGIAVVLAHKPLEDWAGRQDGAFHLHGHRHGNAQPPGVLGMRRMDVGVDVHGFNPISWEQVKATLEAVPPPPAAGGKS